LRDLWNRGGGKFQLATGGREKGREFTQQGTGTALGGQGAENLTKKKWVEKNTCGENSVVRGRRDSISRREKILRGRARHSRCRKSESAQKARRLPHMIKVDLLQGGDSRKRRKPQEESLKESKEGPDRGIQHRKKPRSTLLMVNWKSQMLTFQQKKHDRSSVEGRLILPY